MTFLRMVLRFMTWAVLVPLLRRLRGQARGPSEAFVFAWMLVLAVTVLAGSMLAAGAALYALVFVPGVVLLMPWTVARRVFIPLGMSRAAQALSALAGWTWGQDRVGGGLVAGAWALGMQRAPDRARMAALEAARDAAPGLTGARVLATGLLAAARGDHDAARVLLESVDELGPNTTPAAVHALAREWLVADAAEEGAWQRAAALAGGARARTRMTRLLGAVGARLAAQPAAPSRLHLQALWLISPMRRRTYALMRRAAAAQPGVPAGRVPADHRLETSLEPDPYEVALSAHLRVLGQHATRLGVDDLACLGRAWDRALAAPDVRLLIMQRAAALGARSADRALATLTETVASDLAALARAARVPLTSGAADSRVLDQARRRLQAELLSELELAFDALHARAVDQRALSSIDEWREWLSLRALYVRAGVVGGLELRRLAYPHVHQVACKLGVWLWNERREHLMAGAMFGWLLTEALIVGDAEAIELQSRNHDPSL